MTVIRNVPQPLDPLGGIKGQISKLSNNSVSCQYYIRKFCMQTEVQFSTKLYRQVVGISMGTDCALLVVDLFMFCYERDFITSLSDNKQADVIDAFNTTSRYLDDILNIYNVYFDNMVVKYTLQSSNLIKPIPLIPKPHFKTCICQFLMILFLPKYMINVTTLSLKLSISHFR